MADVPPLPQVVAVLPGGIVLDQNDAFRKLLALPLTWTLGGAGKTVRLLRDGSRIRESRSTITICTRSCPMSALFCVSSFQVGKGGKERT